MPVDVAASMPELDLRDGSQVTVTLDDPGAVITGLVIHGWQELPAPDLPAPDVLYAIQGGGAEGEG